MKMPEGVSVVGRMPFAAAAEAHRTQWFEGKHRGAQQAAYSWPMPSVTGGDFVLVTVPVALLDAEPSSKERVRRYVCLLREGGEGCMGPCWGSYGERAAREGRATVYVVDGNHRAAAAKRAGFTSVVVVMPEEHFRRWLSIASVAEEGQGEVRWPAKKCGAVSVAPLTACR